MALKPSIEKVTLVHERSGRTKQFAKAIWDAWRPDTKDGNTRHGWMLASASAPVKPGSPQVKKETFKPPFLTKEEGGSAPDKPEPPAPEAKAESVPPAKPEQAVNVAELLVIPGMGEKVATAMAKAGFGTLKAIAEAKPDQLTTVLMAINMEPKKSKVPQWIEWAKDATKQTA